MFIEEVNIMEHKQRIDKETFKQIFRDHLEGFLVKHPSYQKDYKLEVIEKMLNCAEEQSGYAKYKCLDCQEERIVPFTCKSSFCLSCARIRLEEWLSQVEETLFEHVDYRHVVLTIPEALRVYFYREPEKLSSFIQVGIEMLKDLMSEVMGKEIEFGYIVLLQTTGRSARYNPHLHIMMTAGGLDEEGSWHDLEYVPFDYLHRKWQYYLFEMMKEEFGGEIRGLIDRLYRKYPKGIVAHIKMEKVPKKEKLAQYLMKYVGSPPIALSRIIEYDGERVKYWYKDHMTGRREVEEVSAITFIGRMMQHILPKGFQRVRYYGLHATCKAKKVAERLAEIFTKEEPGEIEKQSASLRRKRRYRERIKDMIGEDLLECPNCGEEMVLWEIWVPGYGKIYDELEDLKNGKYGTVEQQQRYAFNKKTGNQPDLY